MPNLPLTGWRQACYAVPMTKTDKELVHKLRVLAAGHAKPSAYAEVLENAADRIERLNLALDAEREALRCAMDDRIRAW